MQNAVNEYAEFRIFQEGITVVFTKTRYYEMYHQNVQLRLQQYLPQGKFGWSFNDNFTTVSENATNAEVGRNGTISLNFGSQLSLFRMYATRVLPNGQTFPYTDATTFGDCQSCPAKMLLGLQKGGLDEQGEEWKITSIDLIKLE